MIASSPGSFVRTKRVRSLHSLFVDPSEEVFDVRGTSYFIALGLSSKLSLNGK